MEVADFTGLRDELAKILGDDYGTNINDCDYSDYFKDEASFNWVDKNHRYFEVTVSTSRKEFEICANAWHDRDYNPNFAMTFFNNLSVSEVLDYAKRWKNGEDIQFLNPK